MYRYIKYVLCNMHISMFTVWLNYGIKVQTYSLFEKSESNTSNEICNIPIQIPTILHQ